MATILNVIIVILALFTCIIVWQIYRITHARSVLIITGAVLWATVIRVVVAATGLDAAEWMLGFWILFPTGMYALLRTMKQYIKK
jgi:hypothetical protein